MLKTLVIAGAFTLAVTAVAQKASFPNSLTRLRRLPENVTELLLLRDTDKNIAMWNAQFCPVDWPSGE
jgi:hypothetical protein